MYKGFKETMLLHNFQEFWLSSSEVLLEMFLVKIIFNPIHGHTKYYSNYNFMMQHGKKYQDNIINISQHFVLH